MTEVSDWNSQIRRGLLELCILALLERGPSYGYEIVTRLGKAPRLAASEGTVYPLLRRLRRFGWLETSWEESDAGPPRQYYTLSPAGSEYLKALRFEWSEMTGAVSSFLKGKPSP